ncbi:MAG: aromatic ring-hydroxylating dioxygenase subunit alpha [Verrucomicrobia bacterium]|nr:aromatic ring-hydroxylating dioxygenase subunit alpha [Verrucomicrobiota bacterium]
MNAIRPPVLTDLLQRQPPGHSLLAPFYSDPEVYRADLELIWKRQWIFAGHECEIPEPGDYFSVPVGEDSILVLRDEQGGVRALHNLCRHRGSLICDQPCGQLHKLVCPYHRWVYSLDGSLLHAPGMQEELPREDLGLISVPARAVEGLIYFCLNPAPPEFDEAALVMGSVARPQGLRQAKVAKAVDYLVGANWKLVWENNRECYHCNANHPQYTRANFDHYNADDSTPRIREQMADAVRQSEARWARAGLAASHKQTGMTTFPDAERNIWYSANRTVLADGYLSETMDGRTVAPLMGVYQSPDVGTVRMRSLPNFWNHSSCDHGVSTRLLPAGPERTAVRVSWLVHRDAEEGKDYDLTKLMPFWQLTSEQDWVICERQQRGIRSSAYRPGPYSTYKEYNVDAFVRWYLNHLRGNFA